MSSGVDQVDEGALPAEPEPVRGPEGALGSEHEAAKRSRTGSKRDRARGPVWDRLQDQVGWYDRKSTSNKNLYIRLKIFQLVGAAAVPVAASVHAAVWITGGLGASVVVVEGIQQLGQYHSNWITYRSTAEALKHEKFLYLAGAGPYGGPGDPDPLLAERIEMLISQEHAKWTSAQEQVAHRGLAEDASADQSG